MAEMTCDTKPFTIIVTAEEEKEFNYTWNILTPSPLTITKGILPTVTPIEIYYWNQSDFEHEVCVMLMDGDKVLDANPEGCRDCKCIGFPDAAHWAYIAANPFECGGVDVGAGETTRIVVNADTLDSRLDVGTHNLTVRIRTRKSLI